MFARAASAALVSLAVVSPDVVAVVVKGGSIVCEVTRMAVAIVLLRFSNLVGFVFRTLPEMVTDSTDRSNFKVPVRISELSSGKLAVPLPSFSFDFTVSSFVVTGLVAAKVA